MDQHYDYCEKHDAQWHTMTNGDKCPFCEREQKAMVQSRMLDGGGLKLCPFCGGEAEVENWDQPNFQNYFVRCKCCAAEGPWGKNRATAVNLWNIRAAVV